MAQGTGEAQVPIKASWFLWAASGQKRVLLSHVFRENLE